MKLTPCMGRGGDLQPAAYNPWGNISFNPHTCPVRKTMSLPREENRGSKSFRVLPEITQLKVVRPGLEPRPMGSKASAFISPQAP